MPRALSAFNEALYQGSLWTPAIEWGNLASWFDFSDPATITYATGISQVRSKHYAGTYMEQGTTTRQPAFGEINGRRAASFGATDHVLYQFTAANTTMSNAFVVGIVASITSASGANSRILSLATTGNDFDKAAAMAMIYRSSANTWDTYQNGGLRASTSGCTDGVPHVFVVSSDGTTCRHYRNGVAGGLGNWGTISLGASSRWQIGDFDGAGAGTDLRGLIGEIVAIRGWRPGLAEALSGYLSHGWRRPLDGGPYTGRVPLVGV